MSNKVLIVDDSAIMRRNLRQILENAGFEVVGEASDGKRAYKEYKELEPDLVTMDIAMPEMDGVAAVKNIIKDFPNAKIVMVTSLSQKGLVYQAIKNGAKGYVVKPIDINKVVKSLNDALNSKFNVESAKHAEVKENNIDEVDNIIQFEVISVTEDKEAEFTIKISEKINDKTFPIFLATLEGVLKSNALGICFDFIGIRKLYYNVLAEVLRCVNEHKDNIPIEILCDKENQDLIKWFEEKGIVAETF